MLFLGVALIIIGLLFGWHSPVGILVMGAGVLIATLDIVKTIRTTINKQNTKKTKYEFNCIYISGLPFDEDKCNVKIYAERAEFIINEKTANLELTKVKNAVITDDFLNITYDKNNVDNTIILKIDASDDKIMQAKKYINENVKYEI